MNRDEEVAYLKDVLAMREESLTRCLAHKLNGALHIDFALDHFVTRVNETRCKLLKLGVNPDEP